MKLIIGLILFCLSLTYTQADDCPKFQVVCYYGSWSIYRPEPGAFDVTKIDPSLCTHLIYTFAGLDLYAHIGSLDSQADLVQGGFSKFIGLKENNTCLRTTLAIGGWNEGSLKYSVMVSNNETRAEFVETVVKFLAYYGFDGIDVDWEYPSQRGGLPEDKANFALLIRELKEKIQPWGMTVTIAVPINEDIVDSAYDVATLNQYLDAVHLMAYDYVSSTSKTTGLNAPMSKIEESIKKWLDSGLDKEKLILGLPAYGRRFVLEDTSKNGIGEKVLGPGPASSYTGEKGFLTYYELSYILEDGYEVKDEDGTHYAYKDDDWITFDNVDSYTAKVKYAIENNLGGVMLWTIDTDDFLEDEPFTILSTIQNVIKNKIA